LGLLGCYGLDWFLLSFGVAALFESIALVSASLF